MKKFFRSLSAWVLPVLVLTVTFVFAMFQGGFVSWFLFYSFLPFILIPFLLRFSSFKQVKAERCMKQKQYVYGEPIEVEMTITREGMMPLLYLLIEDQVPARLSEQLNNQHKCVRFPFWRKKITYSYSIPAALRGEHEFNSVKLTTGDFLGFYTRVQEINCFSRLLVYPHYEKVAFRNFEALYEQGQRHSAVRNLNESAMITGVRRYIPGDRMSWIHWKATAKKDEIMTKEFEESKNQDVIIVLDQTPSPLFEDLVSLAASLTYAFLKKGLGVACVGTGSKYASFTIGKGEQHRQRIFYQLAKVEADNTQTMASYIEGKQDLPSQAVLMMVTSDTSFQTLNRWKGRTAAVVIVMQESDSVKGDLSENNNPGFQCAYVTPNSWKSSSKEGVSL